MSQRPPPDAGARAELSLDDMVRKQLAYEDRVAACDHSFSKDSLHAPVSKSCLHCDVSELPWLRRELEATRTKLAEKDAAIANLARVANETAFEADNLRARALTVAVLEALARLEAVADCGDNSCIFAKNKGGMRTNGGCRCVDRRVAGAMSRLLFALDKAREAGGER